MSARAPDRLITTRSRQAILVLPFEVSGPVQDEESIRAVEFGDRPYLHSFLILSKTALAFHS